MAKLQVAIVGTEHCHVRGNVRMLAAREDVEIVAVWGADRSQALLFARPFGLEPLASLDDLPSVDLAIITTDTAGHLAALKALAGRAHAVHMDKPLGINADHAHEVARYAQAYGDLFAVGFFARLNPLVRALISHVKAGDIGRIRHLSLTFGHDGRLAGWLNDWPAFDDRARMGYGCFGDLSAHMLDLACLLVGDLMPLNCVKQVDSRFRLDIGGTATAQGAGGELVRFFSSAVMKGPRLEVRVDGEEGSLWLRGKTLGRYDDEGMPVILNEADWLAAADSPSALIDTMVSHKSSDYAKLEDAIKINRLLDDFEGLPKRG